MYHVRDGLEQVMQMSYKVSLVKERKVSLHSWLLMSGSCGLEYTLHRDDPRLYDTSPPHYAQKSQSTLPTSCR